MKEITLAYSPCPNDTYLFYGWSHNKLPQAPKINTVLADIQQLNEWMRANKYPVTKGSYFSYARCMQEYILLPAGAALGHNCGPKIIAKTAFNLADLTKKRIAIPGSDTTAHLLLCLLCPEPAQKIFCTYDQIGEMIANGNADCGLIIHESRFTFKQQGFLEIADLGNLWEQQYQLPIPLGGIFAARNLGTQALNQISKAIQDSYLYARQHPETAHAYILENSQEKDSKVIQQHIELYVNQQTYALSAAAKEAIALLLRLAAEKKLLSLPANIPWLHEVK